ncbi:MAG: LacI family DNA-binding transcriptional regulator [Elusimicrobiota bacterium]
MKRKKITVHSIAKEMGVSVATVSRALNDMPRVDKRLQLKIKNFAENIGYDRYLRSASRNMKFIVIIIGRAGGHLIEQIGNGIDDRLRKTGYYELRYLIDERAELDSEAKKELFLKNIISERGVAGVMSVFVKLSDVSINNLYKHNLPVVLLNNYTDFGKCVTINNFKASYNAAKAFIDLGRKTIGCIMPREEVDQVWTDRIAGYKTALRENGLEFNPNLVIHEDDCGMKEAGMATKLLLDKNPGIDAILYGSDIQAYGGMKMAIELGRKIPEDIAVIGFDDMQTNKMVTPSLASVSQPMLEMGKLGIEMLLRSIENKDFSHEEIILNTELKLAKSILANYEEEKWK